MTESSKWMVLVTLLVVGVAIGAIVYDAKFRTTYKAETNKPWVKVFQGNKVRYCVLVTKGPKKQKYGSKRRWDKNDYATCTDWLELKTRLR